MLEILVIEAGHELATVLDRFDRPELTVAIQPNPAAALEHAGTSAYDIIIWDVGHAAESSSETAGALRKCARHAGKSPIMIVSSLAAPDDITCWPGEHLWLSRPFYDGQFKSALDAAIAIALPLNGVATASTSNVTPIEFEGMIAMSMAMRMVFQQIVEAAAVDVPVLITGETGTGKDLVAAAIHRRSKRKDAPYLPVNMGAISPDLIASELFGHEKGAYTGASEARPGFFEQAQHGTLFLDEITTMDEKTQVSLLRVLETKNLRRVRGDKDIKVDVRVIAATNEKMEEAVKAKKFREDLFYRLDVFGIHIPPLRERSGGVALLTEHFVSQFSNQYHKQIRTIAPECYRLLRQYAWPGNVRELKNVIQRVS